MSLENCKVSYFSLLPGRGEALRLALAIGGIKFIDERLTLEEWVSVKPTAPWGTMPYLTLSSGAQIGQTRAALRYIGIEVGIYPKDPFQAAMVESVIDALEDIGSKTFSLGATLSDEEKMQVQAEAFAKGGAVYCMYERVEKFIAENGSGGYCVGNTLTIADIFLFIMCGLVLCGHFKGVTSSALDNDFPNVMHVRKTVRMHEAVTKWYSELDQGIAIPPSYGPFV